MKLVFSILFLGQLSVANAASECSAENLKKLYAASLAMNDKQVSLGTIVANLFRKTDEKTKGLELKKEFLPEAQKTSDELKRLVAEIESIAKANPECAYKELYQTKK